MACNSVVLPAPMRPVTTVKLPRRSENDASSIIELGKAIDATVDNGYALSILGQAEGTLEVTATVSDVRQAYAKTVVHAIEEWRLRLAALGAGYEVIRTDSPFGVPLRRAFATRQRLP